MHRRVVELQKDKASRTKVSFIRWKKVIPTFADRMGIVKLKDWRKFERSVKSRINRAMPRKNFRRLSRLSNPKGWFIEYTKWKDEAERAALSVALQLKDELIPLGKWTIDDGIKASKWLDGYNWGVQKPRDDDPQWKGLSESISDYLRKDDVLRNLIKKHIDFSLMCNDMRLVVHYSSKFKDDVFSLMLHEALVGSPFSPEDIEIALSEILSDIDKRLEEIINVKTTIVYCCIQDNEYHIWADNQGNDKDTVFVILGTNGLITDIKALMGASLPTIIEGGKNANFVTCKITELPPGVSLSYVVYVVSNAEKPYKFTAWSEKRTSNITARFVGQCPKVGRAGPVEIAPP
jgi:hypothetical protein